VLHNDQIDSLAELYKKYTSKEKFSVALEVVYQPKSSKMPFSRKLNMLLDLGIATFNKVVFDMLKQSKYPISLIESFPLIDNEDIITINDVFGLSKKYGISVPKYYDEVELAVDGKKGKYSRSRSGCYFCFYQQKIEWVWLYEQHPDLFKMAQEYEKEGYTWNETESLTDLTKPERIKRIKEDYLKRLETKANSVTSDKLIDILSDDTGLSCVNCFI
jgi:hypothetical protein